MKKIYKITIVFFIVLAFNILSLNVVYANSPTGTTKKNDDLTLDWGSGFDLGDNFIKEGSESSMVANVHEEDIKEDMSAMFRILFTIGTILTVIIGVILGISFIMASAEEKAQIKEKMIPYVVGCIVIFGAFGIWSLVVQIVSNIS